MTTKGWLISGVAGVALLSGAGILFLLWTEARPATGPGVPAGALAQPSASPPPAPRAGAPAAPVASPAPPPPAGPAAGPALPDSPAERLKALEPLRREVFSGLAALDPRLGRCRLVDADLLLTLETRGGSVQVVEAQVSAAGAATAEATGVAPPPLDEEAVRCARQVLVGSSLEAPSAVPGRRWQLNYRPGTRP